MKIARIRFLADLNVTFLLKEKYPKVQGCICLATQHPSFAVVCELASLKQHSLRALSTDASLYAHQMRPFIERFAFS